MIHLRLTIIFLTAVTVYSDSIETNVEALSHHDPNFVNLDLEQHLKEKFAKKQLVKERLRKFKEQIAKDTEYFEEIPHVVAVVGSNPQKDYEDVFKNIIGMVGVKYTYKRDLVWRTWREVAYPNKKRKVICYKCQNIIDKAESNRTYCENGGFWVIEDSKPACSYEIFSFKNRNELCVAPFWQLNHSNHSSCPTVTKFDEFLRCGVPVVTDYSVTVDYSKNVSERLPPAICQRRERCEFSTVYNVNPESIVFRIVNTTNNIIFSRIMKRNSKNFICLNNCGIFDFKTLTASRNEDHVVLNLLRSSKKKREHPNLKKHRKNKRNIKGIQLKNKFSNNNLLRKKHRYELQPLKRDETHTHLSPSMCKRVLLKEQLSDEMS